MNGRESLIAALGVILGSVGREGVRLFFRQKQREISEAEEIRKELRAEVHALRSEMLNLHKEIEEWRRKYYALSEEHLKLKQEHIILKAELAILKQRQAGQHAQSPAIPT